MPLLAVTAAWNMPFLRFMTADGRTDGASTFVRPPRIVTMT